MKGAKRLIIDRIGIMDMSRKAGPNIAGRVGVAGAAEDALREM